jgi:hypothetical protein
MVLGWLPEFKGILVGSNHLPSGTSAYAIESTEISPNREKIHKSSKQPQDQQATTCI